MQSVKCLTECPHRLPCRRCGFVCAKMADFFRMYSLPKLKSLDKRYGGINTAVGNTEYMRGKNTDSALQNSLVGRDRDWLVIFLLDNWY